MKTVFTLFCTVLIFANTGHAFDSALTIAEMIVLDGTEMSTRFQVFNNRFEKTCELLIDGVMPRLSPDKGRIAYSNGKPTVPRLVLIDLAGNHLRYPPFLLEKHVRGWQIAGLEWSPDSRQIAIVVSGPRFSRDGYKVRLLVYNLETNRYDSCYRSNSQISEGAYFQLTAKWFPDNRKILVQDNLMPGSEKVVVVDSTSGDQNLVYEGATVSSNLVHNGKDILIVAQEGKRCFSFGGDRTDKKHTISIFNIEKKQLSTIAQPSFSTNLLRHHVIGQNDSKIFILPGSILRDTDLTLVDIDTQGVNTVKLDDNHFFPQAVSPYDHLVLCGLTENGYASLDLNTHEMITIRSFSTNSPTGEQALGPMLFFNRIEWLD